jgi:hypothetical protein
MKKIYTLGAAAAGIAAIAALSGCGGGGGGNSSTGPFVPGVSTFRQQDRLARPVVNEVLATFANNRHLVNDTINPTEDASELKNDIEAFLTHPQHTRSPAIRNVIEAVLVPDVMVADLSKPGPAAYLGVETNGATGSTFGGRKLSDDVVDTSLKIIFGTTVSDLGLAPADGKEIPTLTSDNVPPSNNSIGSFPYLRPPV